MICFDSDYEKNNLMPLCIHLHGVAGLGRGGGTVHKGFKMFVRY